MPDTFQVLAERAKCQVPLMPGVLRSFAETCAVAAAGPVPVARAATVRVAAVRTAVVGVRMGGLRPGSNGWPWPQRIGLVGVKVRGARIRAVVVPLEQTLLTFDRVV